MNRLGRFTVSSRFFHDLGDDVGTNLFHRMIVLRAAQDFVCDVTNYIAVHPDFGYVRDGDCIPEYVAYYSLSSCYPKWVKKI